MTDQKNDDDHRFHKAASNLDYWLQLDITDPERTSKSDYGAKLTSINGVYQFKKMTATFGPCGIGWGYDVIEERMDDTGPLFARTYDTSARKPVPLLDGDNHPIPLGINGQLHTMRISLWYVRPIRGSEVTQEETSVDDRCYIEGIGHTPYRFMNNNDTFPNIDQEYLKKSMTDALTNAMAKLGMSADVRMGLFDNDEYVQGLRDEAAIEAADDSDAEIARQRHEFEDWLAAHFELLGTAGTVRELEILFKGARPRIERQGTKEVQDEHTTTKNTRFKELKQIANAAVEAGKKKAAAEAAQQQEKNNAG